MRIAALALGILAGLLASLILALGGLDPNLFRGADPRYFAFGLSLIASFGIFGAALVLASPLAGAIVMVLSAGAWVAAAILLRHGPDLQLIAPPALFVASAVLSVVAFVRRRQQRPRPVPRLELASSGEPEFDGEGRPMTAGQMFDAEPNASADPVPDLQPLPGYETAEERQTDKDWRPGKRRPPPPRQEAVFREPEFDEYEEEESGFSRFARSVSGILSFGLYAGLATAAALFYVNLRLDQPAVTSRQVAEVSPVSSSSAPLPSAASSSAAPAAPVLGLASSAPQLSGSSASNVLVGDVASSEDLQLRQVGPSTLFAGPDAAASSASFEPIAEASSPEPSSEASALASSSEVPTQLIPDNLLDPTSSSSEPLADLGAASAPPGDASIVMPFTMPAAMAAERAQPSPGPRAAASSSELSPNTGL